MIRTPRYRSTRQSLATACLPLLLAAFLPLAAFAADGSATFRLGPGRNGVAADSANLRADYPADLAPLWTSDGPGAAKGMGAASPTVADGKVFVYATDPKGKAAHEQVHCLDAATGKSLWVKTFPGKPSAYGNHCTPAVGGGRVYVGGGKGQLWCLNAKNGDVVWQKESGGPGASSPLLVDDLVICGNRGTRAYDAANGQPRWEVEGATETHSPAAWVHDGKTYVIATVLRKKKDSQLQCIDPVTGKVVWTVDVSGGLKHTTPAISGDLLAVAGDKGLSVLRLAPDGATVVAQTKDKGGRGTAPIVDGRSIITGCRGGCVRYKVVEGKLQETWQSKATIRGACSSPSLADGKIFGLIELDRKKYDKKGKTFSYPIYYTRVVVVDASTGEELGIFGEKLGIIMVSPVIADGKLYIRGPHGVSCWNLSKK